jgi:hypothetical protein
MSEGADVRLGRIAAKLAAVRAMPALPDAFGVQGHRFELGAPLSEAVVADFEARHEVMLPQAYRLFLTELGDGGAGPGFGLRRLADSCGTDCEPGHLAQASPYLPGPRYQDDWEQRFEDQPGPNRTFLRGTLRMADHGCSLYTQIIVTGAARGRLFNLDDEGPAGPYVVEDPDFLAWYERWLDEAVAGYDVGFFGERLPLDESELIAVLADDPSSARRARAGVSLLQLPAVSDAASAALAYAVSTDAEPTVRAELLCELTLRRRSHRRPTPAEVAADEIARYARSCSPPGLKALDLLRRLTFDDLLPEFASHDQERRRTAAYLLAWSFGLKEVPRDTLDGVVGQLLADPDPLLRAHGVAVVRWFGLVRLHPVLRELQKSETHPWVLHYVSWCLDDQQRPAEGRTKFCDAPPF